MKKIIYYSILFLCLGTFAMSCDKEPAITDDSEVQKLPPEVEQQHLAIMERIKNAPDQAAEIRKINEENGRFVDEKGDVYFNKESFEEITEIRNNPTKRAQTVYNSWYNPNNDAVGAVYYWDNGSYHYLAALQSGEVFVTCPTGFTLCSDYNTYLCIFSKLNFPECTSNCCRDLFGRCWQGTTIRDQDRFSYQIGHPGVTDWWEARIKNSIGITPPLTPSRALVLNQSACGYGHNNQCHGGVNCPGPLCGYFD